MPFRKPGHSHKPRKINREKKRKEKSGFARENHRLDDVGAHKCATPHPLQWHTSRILFIYLFYFILFSWKLPDLDNMYQHFAKI